jgi:putative ABC transport system permease protein
MWNAYTLSSIKHNRASGLALILASGIAALFLSLLALLFFNLWHYDTVRIVAEEGDWHARLAFDGSTTDLERIRALPSVAELTLVELPAGRDAKRVDIIFWNMREAYQAGPQIAQELGLDHTAISYHTRLLAQHLIYDPQDAQPPLLLPFAISVFAIACFGLVLIIRSAFMISLGARIRQFGILASVGASPRQIRSGLMQEAFGLCLLPIVLGNLAGVALCFGFILLVNQIGKSFQPMPLVFQFDSRIWLGSLLLSLLTVYLSARGPAKRLSRIPPLEAIRSVVEPQLKRKKRAGLLALLFGVEGELASISLKARSKALLIANLSLSLSFLAFTLFVCFATLSSISTKYTYFERYKDAWDLMVTFKERALSEGREYRQIAQLDGVASVVAYQKAESYARIGFAQQSESLEQLGGLGALSDKAVQLGNDSYLVEVPLVILDDEAFDQYRQTLGIEGQAQGAILLNRIWNSKQSNFRYKSYIDFLKPDQQGLSLSDKQGQPLSAELPIIGYAMEGPALREEYANFALVQFLPLSLWQTISGQIESVEPDSKLRILLHDPAQIDALQLQIEQLLGQSPQIELENRLQEERDNQAIFQGFITIIGVLCGLFALIGIANVFTNALAIVYQRKREFARYLSLGMTPASIRKILAIEALVIAGRPLLITLPLTVLFVIFAVNASYLDPREFLDQLPILPLGLFMLAILGSVALAYYLGWRQLNRTNLSEALKDDSLL